MYVCPDCMFHERGPSFIVGQYRNLLFKVLIENGNRSHQRPHLDTDALVHQLLYLGPNLGPVHVRVLTEELGTDISADLCKPRQSVHVIQCSRVG